VIRKQATTGSIEDHVSDGIAYELLRFRTRDGDETTVYLTRHPRATTRLALECFATLFERA
jgi:hypothetical protein